MNYRGLSTTNILNDTGELVSTVTAPWLGVLWLTALPLRFLQVHFVNQLLLLGPSARDYGQYLEGLVLGILLAYLLALYGRAVFIRACNLRLRSVSLRPSAIWRVPLAQAATYLYTSLITLVLFYSFALTFLAIPMVLVLIGLSAATYPFNERLDLIRPFKEIWQSLTQLKILLAVSFVFSVALLLAFVNLNAAFQFSLGLVSEVAGLDMPAWERIFSGNHFKLLVFAGACMAVEPFWLAANVVYIRKLKAKHSGEDMRLWFDLIHAGRAS